MRQPGGGDPCPTDAERAALVKGTLDSSRGREVALHLLTCQRCSELVRVPAAAGPSALPRWVAVALGILLTVVVGASVVALKQPAGTTRNPGMDELVEATGEQRLVEGRLSGGFVWAPISVTRGPREEGDSWKIASVAARIGGGADTEADAHALGVAHLLLGNADEAISSLENAARDEEDPAVLSDLAAALIERGKKPDHAEDLIRALDLAEQALTKAPSQPELWFNRALAMESLRLREAAVTAWKRYLEVDGHSAWAREALERLERSQRTTSSSPWPADNFHQACSACTGDAAERMVRDDAQRATEELWELLATWLERSSTGDAPEAALVAERLRCGSAALASVVGDFLFLRVAEEIRSFEDRPDEMRRFVKSGRQLIDGRRLMDGLGASQARRLLTEAVRGLTAANSELRDEAELSRLTSEYYLRTEIQADLLALERRAESAGHSMVAARACWLRGLDLAVRGRPEEALSPLEHARIGLERMGFEADATFVRSIQASTWADLGRTTRAWREFSQVFAELDRLSDPRRAQAAVTAAAAEAQLDGYAHAAVTLQGAAMEYARRHRSPVDLCDGAVWLAELAARAGKAPVAARALADAEGGLKQLSDPAVRKQLGAEIALVHASLLSENDPRAAEVQADRAIDYFQKAKAAPRLVGAHLLRAKASRARGDESDTQAHYQAALQALEDQRAGIVDSSLRVSFLDNSFSLAREIVGYQWSRGLVESALQSADLIRGRTLLETRHATPREAQPPGVLRRRLGPADAVLFYSVLPEKTILWVLRRDTIHGAEVGWDERELRRRVMAWRSAVHDRHRERIEQEASRLFEGLVQPAASHLTGARKIVIVPDGLLHRIAWASLRDAESGRLWIEDVSVAVAPCLTAACQAPAPTTLRVAVAVGNPAFDRELFPELGDLPEASRESKDVAGCYPRAHLLLGAQATPDRVLQASEQADVLHVAAHAVADGADAERSTLALAPGGSISPRGVLLPRHVRDRQLDHLELVVLAACRSGDGPLSEAEGPLSLARSFLEAGARSVIVSLFDFPDTGTTAVDIHRHLMSGLDPMEAFRRSIKDCWLAPSSDPMACGSLQLIVNHREG